MSDIEIVYICYAVKIYIYKGTLNFDVKAENQLYIKLYLGLGKTSVQTKELLKQTLWTKCVEGFSLSLAWVIYWQTIKPELTSTAVLESLRNDACQTVFLKIDELELHGIWLNFNACGSTLHY